jgi:tetratricopeptide (TPR) repeat protein
MNRYVEWNNAGASQVVSGLYADAVTSFTKSLKLVKAALANHVVNMQQDSCAQSPHQRNTSAQATASQRPAVIMVQERVPGACSDLMIPYVLHGESNVLNGLFVSPLFLSDSNIYDEYEPTVEASVAIVYNLALATHLSALCVDCSEHSVPVVSSEQTSAVSTLEQAVALYELAYTVQMNEEAELSVEYGMAILNNLGHIHRLLGDEEKASKCFRHLLSTIVFLQSCGDFSNCCETETFVRNVTYLILKETSAAAA